MKNYSTALADFFERNPLPWRVFTCLLFAYGLLVQIAPYIMYSAPYTADGGAYLGITADLIRWMNGEDVFIFTGERTILTMLPVAVLGYITHLQSPQAFVGFYALLYVVPLYPLIGRLATALRWPRGVAYMLPSLIFADTYFSKLSGGYFTDPPIFLFALAGLYFFVMAEQGSYWKRLVLAAIFFAWGTVLAWYTMILMVPALGLFVLFRHGGLDKRILIRLMHFSLLSLAFCFVLVVIFDLWGIIRYNIELRANFYKDVWKYGLGTSEYNVGNLKLHRAKMAVLNAWDLFQLTLALGLAVALLRLPRLRTLGFYLLSFVLMIGICTTAITNGRYILPSLLITILAMVLQPLCRRDMFFAVFGILAACLYSSVGQLMHPANSLSTVTSPYYGIINKLLADSAGQEGKRALYSLIPSNRDILPRPYFYLCGLSIDIFARAEKLSHPAAAAFNNNFDVPWGQIGEFDLPETYNGLLLRIAAEMQKADYVLAPVIDRPLYFADGHKLGKDTIGRWTPQIQLVDILARPRGNEAYALELMSREYIIAHEDGTLRYYPVNLYKVRDKKIWQERVSQLICANPEVTPTAEICPVQRGALPHEKEIRPKPNTLVSSAYTTHIKDKPYLAVTLKDAPPGRYQRIYLHFMPVNTSLPENDRCNFFTHDIDVYYPGAMQIVALSVDEAKRIASCNYELKGGVRSIGKDFFDYTEYKSMMKTGSR